MIKLAGLSKKWIGKVLYLSPTNKVRDDILGQYGYRTEGRKVSINALNFPEWYKAKKDKSLNKILTNREILSAKKLEGPFTLDATWRLGLRARMQGEVQNGRGQGRANQALSPNRNQSKGNDRPQNRPKEGERIREGQGKQAESNRTHRREQVRPVRG